MKQQGRFTKQVMSMMCGGALGCAVLGFAATLSARAEVTDADKSFLSMAAQSDVNEIQISQLAESKATDPRVKAFAEKMVHDHTALEARMKPFAEAWGLTPPSGPDPEHQAILDKLNGLSGAEFDKAYMDAMVKDHQKALDAFTQEASSTTDAKFKAAVLHGKSVVAQHNRMADSLDPKLTA
jgi:putative membrane protein